MTMPITAAYISSLGPEAKSPRQLAIDSDLHRERLLFAQDCLQQDLGDVVAKIGAASLESQTCECGAAHLRLDDFSSDPLVFKNAVRLLATPFGGIMLEVARISRPGITAIKFGWEGLEAYAPTFVKEVDRLGHRAIYATEISNADLNQIVAAVRTDMPLAVDMMERSAQATHRRSIEGYLPFSINPEVDGGYERWGQRVFQLMFCWSTPLKKYLNEWLMRTYSVRGAAINCCMFPTENTKPGSHLRKPDDEQLFDIQWRSQRTPDC
ncbi:hypothetical protein FJZ39_02690 [Candidatus Saccharibacteria bacterium]|nr:hypothetical protein [Candidatus Saccharibacteria bacterium]